MVQKFLGIFMERTLHLLSPVCIAIIVSSPIVYHARICPIDMFKALRDVRVRKNKSATSNDISRLHIKKAKVTTFFVSVGVLAGLVKTEEENCRNWFGISENSSSLGHRTGMTLIETITANGNKPLLFSVAKGTPLLTLRT
jgi:hypothetical protein